MSHCEDSRYTDVGWYNRTGIVDIQSHALQQKLELTKFLKEQCISFFPFIYSIVFKGRVYLSGVLTPCH
ncbi:hypothetical protein Taro_014989 [Colocasia esculenta]|uniref:Uncharacterized protein n=1 Tax=Colocasia esculenta TaxID=4460 RepID=A0A843UKU5_COLES|nr:hypothetical protein [Colocasia esculenta]